MGTADEVVKFCSHCEESMWWVHGIWLCGHCDGGGMERATWMKCYDEDDDDPGPDDPGYEDDYYYDEEDAVRDPRDDA